MYTVEECEKIISEYYKNKKHDPEIPLCTGLNSSVEVLNAKAFLDGYNAGKQAGKIEVLDIILSKTMIINPVEKVEV